MFLSCHVQFFRGRLQECHNVAGWKFWVAHEPEPLELANVLQLLLPSFGCFAQEMIPGQSIALRIAPECSAYYGL